MKIFRFAVAAICFLFAASVANAASEISTASGNIDSSGTWSAIEPNTFLNSETANTALTTSFTGTNALTPGAVTIQGIAVKLASVAASPSGTLTCRLFNSTGSLSIDSVTVNVSDLVTAAAATSEGGWIVFEFGSTHLLITATNYEVQCETSVASQVNLFSSGTTVWSQMLIETTAVTPSAGDALYVFGELTGAGTHNAFTVTVETTSNISYGSASNTLVSPSISVGQYGTLAFASSASTAYKMEVAGPEVTYNGGTFTIGTSGTPIPSTGSATLTLNSSTEGDTGLNTRNGGTFNTFGSSGGRSVVNTKLTATATASVTSTLTTAVSTGWLSGDSIEIAATQITTGTAASYKDDQGTLTSNASGTSVPLTAVVSNTHTATQLSYTSSSTGNAYSMNMYADVVLLNRNVIIQGSGATTNGYLYFQASSNAAMQWVEFSNISGVGGTAGKRGIEADTGPGGTFSLTYFSIINSHNSALVLAPTNTDFGGTSSSYLLVQHGTLYNVATNNVLDYGLAFLTSTLNPFWKIDDIVIIRAADASINAVGADIFAENGQFTNVSVTGSGFGALGAINLASGYSNSSIIGGQVGNTWGPINIYTNVGYSLTSAGTHGVTGTISGMYIWHEQGRFTPTFAQGSLTIDPFYLITNAFGIYVPSGGGSSLTVRNGVIGWDASGSSFPLTVDSVNNSSDNFDNMELCPDGTFGGVTFVQCAGGANNLISLAHDIGSGFGYNPIVSRVFLRNTSMVNNVGTKYPTLSGEEAFYSTGFVAQDCAACSPVTHGAWVAGGFLNYDTVITHTSGYSERMTPRINTVSGYISSGSGSTAPGTTLTLTSGTPATNLADTLTSNGSGFIGGTNITAGSGSSYTVSQNQSVGSSASPVQFQSYYNAGSLLRMQSAPHDYGTKVAVKNGATASVCAYVRPSINTDTAPPWGGSAVTYNGDNPRMLVRQNPYMGVQADTVLTSTPTPAFSAGTWSQLCATTPTAPADGQFEIVVDADQTFTSNAGGSINVAEWSCSSTCNTGNNSEFWWNGSPTDFAGPNSSGGGFMILH
jgi:hypothetical protein